MKMTKALLMAAVLGTASLTTVAYAGNGNDFDYKDHESVQMVAKLYAQAIHTSLVNELRGVTDQWFLGKIKEELAAITVCEEV